MKAMCPPGYHHNGFAATHAIGHMSILCVMDHLRPLICMYILCIYIYIYISYIYYIILYYILYIIYYIYIILYCIVLYSFI